ncbi:hypothetical protein MC885_008798 [Smutsia gigantea]|nr:hypothetical protein MC885_008798 [Smutsia gigantea]
MTQRPGGTFTPKCAMAVRLPCYVAFYLLGAVNTHRYTGPSSLRQKGATREREPHLHKPHLKPQKPAHIFADSLALWGLSNSLGGKLSFGLKDAAVTQFPRHMISGAGKNITLQCSQNMNHISMYWYRQDPGFGLQLIYYSNGRRNIEKGDIPEGYHVSRTETESFSLTLGSAGTNQTAVYFCASSESTVWQSHTLSAQKEANQRMKGHEHPALEGVLGQHKHQG